MSIVKTHSYEFLLAHFGARHGLFILGAGASAGQVPLGKELLTGPAFDYVRSAGSFPVIPPKHSALSERIIDAARGILPAHIFRNREIRPGTTEFPYQEILERMPDAFARLHMQYNLAKVLQSRQADNYRVFQLFYPSMLLNYNLDGLATYIGTALNAATRRSISAWVAT
jgi:hypothetical protein